VSHYISHTSKKLINLTLKTTFFQKQSNIADISEFSQ